MKGYGGWLPKERYYIPIKMSKSLTYKCNAIPMKMHTCNLIWLLETSSGKIDKEEKLSNF